MPPEGRTSPLGSMRSMLTRAWIAKPLGGRHIGLLEADRGQRLSAGDSELGADEVDAGHFLGHGVLDLDARIRLNEGEVRFVVGIDQELEGAQAAVVVGRRQANRS